MNVVCKYFLFGQLQICTNKRLHVLCIFQDQTFEVPAGDLGFSVTIFTVCALVTITLLMLRRYISFFGGELGGPKGPKIACGVFLIFVWIFYVLMSSFQTYGHIQGF